MKGVRQKRSSRGDTLVQFDLSVCSVGKKILKETRVTSSRFQSMVEPWADTDSVREVLSSIQMNFPEILLRYCPRIQELPLNQGRAHHFRTNLEGVANLWTNSTEGKETRKERVPK